MLTGVSLQIIVTDTCLSGTVLDSQTIDYQIKYHSWGHYFTAGTESTTLIVDLNLYPTFIQNIENILFNSPILWNKGLIEKLKR